jgi:hypothetical protein
MLPRLWVPQVRGHILHNFAWNTMLLLGLPLLYVLLPQIVAIGHGYLRGSGYVPSRGISQRRTLTVHAGCHFHAARPGERGGDAESIFRRQGSS